MLEQDAMVKEIDVRFSLGEGYHKAQVRYVNGDPIRFAQVVLNFLSNAIGFSEGSPVRIIDVGLDASMEEPTFLQPVAMASAEHTSLHAESLFLICTVRVADSGGGLTADEQAKLLYKITQAPSKTYIEWWYWVWTVYFTYIDRGSWREIIPGK